MRENLDRYGFKFKKAYGQNFIFDKNLLDAIVSDAGISSESFVLEIGAGAGDLTRVLAARARAVVSYEIDKTLEPVLSDALAGVSNVKVVFADFLKASDTAAADFPQGASIEVVANLPYYITTPIIFKLLESPLNIKSITVTVQKEVAERMTARAGGKDYGVLTVMLNYAADVEVTRKIGRAAFFPAPEVDSAVVKITLKPDKPEEKEREIFYKTVRAAFAMRRKTLGNNISAAFNLAKADAEEKIRSAGLSPAARGETLTIKDFICLSRKL